MDLLPTKIKISPSGDGKKEKMKETLRKILGGFFALGAMVYFSM